LWIHVADFRFQYKKKLSVVVGEDVGREGEGYGF
jgi:hypothetical protein